MLSESEQEPVMNRTRSLVASLVALGILQTTPSLIAQQESRFRANVPFQFSVDNKTMPAGEYSIVHRGVFLRIDCGTSGIYVMTAIGEPSQNGHTSLVFDRVNGSYYLRKLVTPSSSDSMDLPASRTEKKALALEHLAAASPTETRTIDLPTGGQ
jgi:hypothetical protein